MKRVGILSAIVFVAIASSAQAQAPQQLYACVNNNSGTIKIVAPGTICDNGATLFVWNTQGRWDRKVRLDLLVRKGLPARPVQRVLLALPDLLARKARPV